MEGWAQKDDISVQYRLWEIYYSKRHDAKAIKYLMSVANQGHIQAQYNLGVLYQRGDIVSRDDLKSAEWYQKAADQKHIESQYNLGIMYCNGTGVSRGYTKALEWITKAASQGHNDSQYFLVRFMKKG